MKTHILRLNSNVTNGIGSSPECAALDMIYTFLLTEHNLNVYNYINIIQIGSEQDELIRKEGNNVHICIRFPTVEGFDDKPIEERNIMRLELIHAALLRLDAWENKLDQSKLQSIKDLILHNNFCFELTYKTFPSVINPGLIGKVLINPQIDRFNFYVQVEDTNRIICKKLVYSSIPIDTFLDYFFSRGKWRGMTKLTISGKIKELEIQVDVDTCEITVVNLSRYSNPPTFQVFKYGLTKEEGDKAYADWLHSLDPSVAGVISRSQN